MSTQPEVAWLLERVNPESGAIEFLGCEETGVFEWTTDSLKALRLSRRQDGEALAHIIEDAQYVREHMWL